ncbi:hypothetical protein L0156_10280 [bacterium]|nr:hypothetical protein [bacterium]
MVLASLLSQLIVTNWTIFLFMEETLIVLPNYGQQKSALIRKSIILKILILHAVVPNGVQTKEKV